MNRGGRGKLTAKRETLPQSAGYSSHSDSELHPCLWSSLLNKVRVEKYSEEKMARHRYSSESTTTTRARLAGAMLCYMCDARERKLLQFDQTAQTRPPHARFSGRPIRRPQPEKTSELHVPTYSAAVKPVPPASSETECFPLYLSN